VTGTATSNAPPDAVRLVIDLSNKALSTTPAQAQQGRLSLDWIRPNFSNNKS
jgi:hypothetical protein